MAAGKRSTPGRPEAHVIGAAHTRFGEQWEKSYRDLMTEAQVDCVCEELAVLRGQIVRQG